MGLVELKIAVAYCAPGIEHVAEVRLPLGSTVRDAVAAARLKTQPESDGAIDAGIWGRRCSLDRVLNDGDRVEIYRPLIIDPKEARRRRAALRRRDRALKA
ncbi:MAG: RnfH family protein [Burkholderiaceae bacterium]|nr:RnfH family protein [Burkholderiaceae bacterium]